MNLKCRIILNYPGGPNVITRVLIRGVHEDQCQTRRCDEGRRGWSNLWPVANEYRLSLEIRKSKETDFPHKKDSPAHTLDTSDV